MEGVSKSSSQQQLVSPSSHRLLPMPVTVSGISFVSCLWMILTFVLTSCLIIPAAFSSWTTIDRPATALQAINIKSGLFYFCYTPGLGSDSTIEEVCALYVSPAFRPSNNTNLATIELDDIAALFTSSLCYGIGTGLYMITVLVGIVALSKPRIKKQSVFLVAFVIQLFACKYSLNESILMLQHT